MTTLLMRMRAPMMSWGDHSRFTIRDTRREPTKSAVIGLLCAALGRPRWEPVHDLAALKMGVRIDREGVMLCDYHTIMDSIKSSGSKGDTVLSDRYYMADADYLVGLEGDRALLETLDAALESPCWQLYFGRKSFIPSCPVRVHQGITELELADALKDFQNYPTRWQQLSSKQDAMQLKRGFKEPKLRCVLEVENNLDTRRDVPLDWQKRLFGSRCVETKYLEVVECISLK
jgi:CRISPR system Cascade subunit CasD